MVSETICLKFLVSDYSQDTVRRPSRYAARCVVSAGCCAIRVFCASLSNVLRTLLADSKSVTTAGVIAFLAATKEVILGVVEVVVAMVTLLKKVNTAVTMAKELVANIGETLAAIDDLLQAQWGESLTCQ